MFALPDGKIPEGGAFCSKRAIKDRGIETRLNSSLTKKRRVRTDVKQK